MKVLGLINKDSGPGFHRIMQPLIMMDGVDAYITNVMDEATISAKSPDIVYYNRFVNEEIFEHRHKYNYKIVVDVDDYWHLDVHHIAYNQYKDNKVAAIQEFHLREADLITTTHERLAEVIYPFNKNIIITPNAIPKNEYFSIKPIFSAVARLFYQGSITHEGDLKLLHNPLKRVRAQKIIGGYTKHEVWDRMCKPFEVRINALPPEKYYSMYEHADICLVPLLNTRFNAFKSNLKVLEAGHANLPCVVSEVNPYLNMPVFYVKQQTDWFKHINALVKSPQMRFDAGVLLNEWCEKHHNFNKINSIRYEGFQKLIGAPKEAQIHFGQRSEGDNRPAA